MSQHLGSLHKEDLRDLLNRRREKEWIDGLEDRGYDALLEEVKALKKYRKSMVDQLEAQHIIAHLGKDLTPTPTMKDLGRQTTHW